MPIPRKLAPGIVMLPNLAKKRPQNCKTGSRNKRESERPRIALSGKRSMRALPMSPATFLRYVTILLIPATSAVETPAQNFVGKSSSDNVADQLNHQQLSGGSLASVLSQSGAGRVDEV